MHFTCPHAWYFQRLPRIMWAIVIICHCCISHLRNSGKHCGYKKYNNSPFLAPVPRERLLCHYCVIRRLKFIASRYRRDCCYEMWSENKCSSSASLSPNCHPFIPLSLFFVCVYLYLEYFLMTLCVSLRRHIYQFKLANETILVDSRMRDKVCDVFIFFLQRVVFFPLFTSSLAIITTS